MILFISFLIVALLCIIFPESKKVMVIVLMFMWVIFAFNYSNGDYINYLANYDKISYGDFKSFLSSEEGFVIFNYICSHYLKLTYQGFLCVYSAVCTIIVGLIIKKISLHPNITLILFILNPYWMMICQIRYYMAFLIATLAILCLNENKGLRGIIQFFLLIFISGFFHRMGWVHILFIVTRLKDIKKIAGISLGMTFAMILLRSPIGLKLAGIVINPRKIISYLGTDSNRGILGVSIMIAIRLIIIAVSVYLCNRIRSNQNVTLDEKERALYLLKIIIAGTMLLGLEAFNKNFERFFRMSLLMFYVIYSNYRSTQELSIKTITKGTVMFAGINGLYYAFYYVSFSGWFEKNLIPILTENLLVENLVFLWAK